MNPLLAQNEAPLKSKISKFESLKATMPWYPLGGVPKAMLLKGIKSTTTLPRKTFRLQRRRRFIRPPLGGTITATRSVRNPHQGIPGRQSLNFTTNSSNNFNFNEVEPPLGGTKAAASLPSEEKINL